MSKPQSLVNLVWQLPYYISVEINVYKEHFVQVIAPLVDFTFTTNAAVTIYGIEQNCQKTIFKSKERCPLPFVESIQKIE